MEITSCRFCKKSIYDTDSSQRNATISFNTFTWISFSVGVRRLHTSHTLNVCAIMFISVLMKKFVMQLQKIVTNYMNSYWRLEIGRSSCKMNPSLSWRTYIDIHDTHLFWHLLRTSSFKSSILLFRHSWLKCFWSNVQDNFEYCCQSVDILIILKFLAIFWLSTILISCSSVTPSSSWHFVLWFRSYYPVVLTINISFRLYLISVTISTHVLLKKYVSLIIIFNTTRQKKLIRKKSDDFWKATGGKGKLLHT